MRSDSILQDEFYPFSLRYATEQACADALFSARWPNGFQCSRCGCRQAYIISTRKLYECSDCKYQLSLIVGTVFENTRTKLTKWFTALFLISRSTGISAVKLQQIIGTTYKTAWLILTKIRYAMSRSSEASLLTGIVRVNAATYGRRLLKTIGDLRGEYPVVAGASMDNGNEPVEVKIKMSRQQHPVDVRGRREATEDFKRRHVDPTVTDVMCAYKRCCSERFIPLLTLVNKATRWIHSTFGGIQAKHLQAYLDEFSYRYNEETRVRNNSASSSNSCGVFKATLDLCAFSPALYYSDIVHSQEREPRIFAA